MHFSPVPKNFFRVLNQLIVACTFTFSVASVTAQNNFNSDLIPRSEFFKGVLYTDVKLNPNGTVFYFRRTDQPDKIYLKSVQDAHFPIAEKLDSITYPGPVQQYVSTTAGVICLWTDEKDKTHFSLGYNEIEVPFEYSRLRILPHPVYDNETPVQVTTKDDKAPSLYVFYGNTELFVYKQSIPEPCRQKMVLDREFNIVAGTRQNAGNANLLSYFSASDSSWKLIEDHEWGADLFLGGFSDIISGSLDGKQIYYTSNKKTDKAQVYQLNVETGEKTLIAKNDKVDLLPFGASINTKGDVTSVVGIYAETQRSFINDSVAEDFEYVHTKLDCDISFSQSAGQDDIWLIRTFRGGPMDFYWFNRNTKELKKLLTDYPYLRHKALAQRKAFEVTSHDGMKLPVHVYLPPGSDANGDGIPDKPLPTILYVHGGPWVGVVHWNQYWHWRNFQLLANRGYAVINCEFRGTTGMGKKVTNKSTKKWGTAMTQDKVSIAKWAVKNGIADKEKTGIWGWSYGGYAAMAGPAFAPETYACGVSMFGISDLEAFGKIPFADDPFWKRMVGDPAKPSDAKMLTKQSPINYVRKIKAPLLLTTGSKDQRIPKSQIDRMAEEMVKKNKEVVYFYYPEEVHDYRDPNSWISFWAITEQFLEQHLGGKAQPIGNDMDKGNLKVVEGKSWIESKKE